MRLTSTWFLIVRMIRLQVAHMEHRVKLEAGWEFHNIRGFANLLDDREWSFIFPQQALVQATSTLVLRRIELHKDLVASLELHIPSLAIRPFLHLL